MGDLQTKSEEFAKKLSEIVNKTLSKDIEFQVTLLENETAIVSSEAFKLTDKMFIPITVGLGEGEAPWLWLKVFFRLKLKGPMSYLTVQNSVFSLAINKKTGLPAIRIEFDRDQGFEPDDMESTSNRSAAHVHIHGVSPEISYIQGRQKASKLKSLEDFHFPVGGRRFRPSLEDFIEFIHKEGLIPVLHDGWREVVNLHRTEWLKIQLMGAVEQYPEVAATKLRELGYEVNSRSGVSPAPAILIEKSLD